MRSKCKQVRGGEAEVELPITAQKGGFYTLSVCFTSRLLGI
jgi:hypothetical protein